MHPGASQGSEVALRGQVAGRLVTRGFRNLADGALDLPPAGAALLGANGQGKTNLLEALYYPVLFRSVRGASDAEIAAFGGPGFHVSVELASGGGPRGRPSQFATTYVASGRRKQVTVDGADVPRLSAAVGGWLAVAFLPGDVALAGGAAVERRSYLDRTLSLADPAYLSALSRYRAALAQRNSALRQRREDVAAAFDGPLAQAGAVLVARRLAWTARAAERFAEEFDGLGERGRVRLSYRGRAELADVAAWDAALREARSADLLRATTTVGPHRDDVLLELDGRRLRAFGSTGQQRSAAIALKLIELGTLRDARDDEPALLLDDVFAELDADRQRRLASRLLGSARQVFLTAPRADELPAEIGLPVWTVADGVVSTRAASTGTTEAAP